MERGCLYGRAGRTYGRGILRRQDGGSRETNVGCFTGRFEWLQRGSSKVVDGKIGDRAPAKGEKTKAASMKNTYTGTFLDGVFHGHGQLAFSTV